MPRKTPNQKFPETILEIKPWVDQRIEQIGHPLHSHYVEEFWLSILGPSSFLLLRRISKTFRVEPKGYSIRTEQLSLELGLGKKGGRHCALWRAVERVCRFKAAKRNGPTLVVRNALPSLSPEQVSRLPPHLQLKHHYWPDQPPDTAA